MPQITVSLDKKREHLIVKIDDNLSKKEVRDYQQILIDNLQVMWVHHYKIFSNSLYIFVKDLDKKSHEPMLIDIMSANKLATQTVENEK